MPIGATISAIGSIGSALIGSSAASRASQAAIAAQQGMFGVANNALAPFIKAGQGAASTLTKLLTPGPNQTATLSQLPGFQFAQDWGQKAVQNIGSTQGFGGNTLTAGANFATGLAQQQFGSLAGLLQNLTNSGVSAGGSLAGAATSAGQGIANSAASGILGSANAISGGISGVTNSLTNSLLLDKLFPSAGIYSGFNSSQLGTPSLWGSGEYVGSLGYSPFAD